MEPELPVQSNTPTFLIPAYYRVLIERSIVAADSSPSSTTSAGSAATGTSGGGLPSESASTTPNSESGTTAPPSFQNGAEHLAFGSLLGWIVVGFGVGGLLV